MPAAAPPSSTPSHARAADYALARRLLDPGFSGVAVALRDRRGDVPAALGMTLSRAGWPDEAVVGQLLPALRETAQALRPVL